MIISPTSAIFSISLSSFAHYDFNILKSLTLTFFSMILHFCFTGASFKSINFLMFSLVFPFIKVLYIQSLQTASDYVMNNVGGFAGHYSAGLLHFCYSQNTEIAVLWMWLPSVVNAPDNNSSPNVNVCKDYCPWKWHFK